MRARVRGIVLQIAARAINEANLRPVTPPGIFMRDRIVMLSDVFLTCPLAVKHRRVRRHGPSSRPRMASSRTTCDTPKRMDDRPATDELERRAGRGPKRGE